MSKAESHTPETMDQSLVLPISDTMSAFRKAGNRICKTDTQGELGHFYTEKNQLIAEEGGNGRKQFTYDRQGGIVEEKRSAGIRLFSYNSSHQQTKVETESGEVQENRYDVEYMQE